MPIYAVDLTRTKPVLLEYDEESLREDLLEFDADSPDDLDDFDWKIFNSESKASAWIDRYNAALLNLKSVTESVSKKLPTMLMSRRYLAQVMMDEKTSTFRDYLKPRWQPGMQINFYDQTYFVTCEITSIEYDEDEELYEYSFKRISK